MGRIWNCDRGIRGIGVGRFRRKGRRGKMFVLVDTVDAGVKPEGFTVVTQAVSQASF